CAAALRRVGGATLPPNESPPRSDSGGAPSGACRNYEPGSRPVAPTARPGRRCAGRKGVPDDPRRPARLRHRRRPGTLRAHPRGRAPALSGRCRVRPGGRALLAPGRPGPAAGRAERGGWAMTTATASRNGAFPRDARSAAEVYLAKGLSPIPLPPRSKDPGYAGWQHLRLKPDALDDHFPVRELRNVGILNGTPSGNALDVDLDCVEALLAAPLLLPPTGWIFGRTSAPRSHWVYRADRPLDAAQEKFADLDGAILVELRGTGGLTVYPPSTHKDTGERIAWERFSDPADVTLVGL